MKRKRKVEESSEFDGMTLDELEVLLLKADANRKASEPVWRSLHEDACIARDDAQERMERISAEQAASLSRLVAIGKAVLAARTAAKAVANN